MARKLKEPPKLRTKSGNVRDTHGVFSSRVRSESEKAATILARHPHRIHADLVFEYSYFRVLVKRSEFYKAIGLLRRHGFQAIVEGS